MELVPEPLAVCAHVAPPYAAANAGTERLGAGFLRGKTLRISFDAVLAALGFGAIGRRLTPLLLANGHAVVGTTRSEDKSAALRALGAEPVVVDVFNAEALQRAVLTAQPDAVIHQLTDLAFAPGTPQYQEGLARNARLRVEGTRNLVAAALAGGVRRVIAQSIAFIYAPGPGARVEDDPLKPAEGAAGGGAAGCGVHDAPTTVRRGRRNGNHFVLAGEPGDRRDLRDRDRRLIPEDGADHHQAVDEQCPAIAAPAVDQLCESDGAGCPRSRLLWGFQKRYPACARTDTDC